MCRLHALPGHHRCAVAQAGRNEPQRQRVPVQQGQEGVYHAIGTGSLAVVGNSSVIVNDNDVIIVDDHVSPAAAWVLLEEVKTLTRSR